MVPSLLLCLYFRLVERILGTMEILVVLVMLASEMLDNAPGVLRSGR